MLGHISGNHGAAGGPVVSFNGHDIRVRQSEGFTLYPCGCGHYEREWGQMCEPAAAECRALHEEALLEHATRPEEWLAV